MNTPSALLTARSPNEQATAAAACSQALLGLARRLVVEGLLGEAAALRAEDEANAKHTTLLRHVIESGLVPARLATEAASREFGLPIIDLDTLDLTSLPPASSFPEALLREHCVLPLKREEHNLSVAVPYPSTLSRLDELQFVTGLILNGVLAPIDQLQPTLDAYLSQRPGAAIGTDGGIERAIGELEGDEGLAASTQVDEALAPADGSTQNDDAPVVKFVNTILLDAVRRGASDIHFEPFEERYRIRFRIDGILHEIAQPPFSLRGRIAARLKVMARLDISERRLPQDGALKIKAPGMLTIDFRVSSLPTVHGEKLVLRLLDPASAQIGIEQLGFSASQRELFEAALASPQGMILVTGPTGSGKTVTLYTGINRLNEVARNICTAEDPVEIKVPGINQVNVMPRIGLDFASALRAFLRQDPDVVMVGEVRDLETAEIAIKAAQTGHLVLSTLHTNSAADTLTRLANMGIASFNIASSVTLIIAQRLARRLCERCKQAVSVPHEALIEQGFCAEQLTDPTLYEPVGCQHCTQGYKGRIGLFEVVPVSDAIRRLILNRGQATDFDQQARREGHGSLRQCGLSRVLEGVTSLAEVCRVTRHEPNRH
ncbi:type IV-A pilus assembly ATPase PilB [Halomonas sp. V046]|uniref:type IV-A pilus assembly ATPase PilB n=1 Tax=Halomonas sp. V046 TaxID=3459611 RepID=UPI004044C06A